MHSIMIIRRFKYADSLLPALDRAVARASGRGEEVELDTMGLPMIGPTKLSIPPPSNPHTALHSPLISPWRTCVPSPTCTSFEPQNVPQVPLESPEHSGSSNSTSTKGCSTKPSSPDADENFEDEEADSPPMELLVSAGNHDTNKQRITTKKKTRPFPVSRRRSLLRSKS